MYDHRWTVLPVPRLAAAPTPKNKRFPEGFLVRAQNMKQTQQVLKLDKYAFDLWLVTLVVNIHTGFAFF